MSGDAGKPKERAHATFGETMKAVLWSFTGLRRRKDYEQDVHKLRFGYVLAAVIIATLLFIFGLYALVQLAVKTA